MDIPISHLYKPIPKGHWCFIAKKVEAARAAETKPEGEPIVYFTTLSGCDQPLAKLAA